MPDNKDDYYNYLKSSGADVPDNSESFYKTLGNPETAEQYYNYLSEGGFDVPETFDSFSTTLGLDVKKKDSTQLAPTDPTELDSTIPLSEQDLATQDPGSIDFLKEGIDGPDGVGQDRIVASTQQDINARVEANRIKEVESKERILSKKTVDNNYYKAKAIREVEADIELLGNNLSQAKDLISQNRETMSGLTDQLNDPNTPDDIKRSLFDQYNKTIDDTNLAIESLNQMEGEKATMESSVDEAYEFVEEKTYGEELFEAFSRGTAGLGEMILRTPSFIYDIFAIPQNLLAEHGMIPSDIATSSEEIAEGLGLPENKLADFYARGAEQGLEAIHKKYDQRVSQYLFGEETDYEKGFKLLSTHIMESVPITLSILMGNAAGATPLATTLTGGAVFGAAKMEQLRGEGIGDMEQSTKTMNALATGLFEGFFEQFGITKLAGVAKDVFLKEGKDAALEIAKRGFIETYGPIMKKYIGVGFEESLAEAATQFAENVVDKYSGAKPDIDIREGLIDAALVGLGSSIVFSTPVAVADVMNTSKDRAKMEKLERRKAELEDQISNPLTSNAAKDVVTEEIADVKNEITDTFYEAKEDYDKLTDAQKEKSVSISKEISTLEEAASDPTLNEESKEAVNKKVEVLNKQLEEIKPKEDAVQRPEAEVVPVQPETEVSEEVRLEDTKGEEITEEGKKEIVQDAPVEKKPIKELTDEEFKGRIINSGFFASVGDVYENRVDLGLPTKEVRKGIEDIKKGEDTAAARKITDKIAEIKETGIVPMIYGSGGQTQRTNMELSDFEDVIHDSYSQLTPDEAVSADKISDNLHSIISEEGITLDNIDAIIEEKGGFPYSSEDLNLIKEHLEDGKKYKEGVDVEGEAIVDEGKVVEEAAKPEPEVEKPTIKESAKKIADKLRKGKMDDDIMLTGIPFGKQAFNAAIEVGAKTIEAGGTAAQAVIDAVNYLKNTDAYKNLTDKEKRAKIEQMIKDKFVAKEKPKKKAKKKPTPKKKKEDEPKVSGIKKALIPIEAKMAISYDTMTDEQIINEGRKSVESGKIDPDQIIDQIVGGEYRVLQPVEVPALIYHKSVLDKALNDEYAKIDKLEKGKESTLSTDKKIKDLQDRIFNYQYMSAITGTQMSLAFRLRQGLRDSNTFDVVQEINKYKKVNNGVISKEVKKKFKDMDSQIKKLESDLKKVEEQRETERSQEDFNDIIEYESRKPKKKTKAQRTRDAATKLAKKIREGKIHKPTSFSAGSPLSLIWDTALEILAKTIEAGGSTAVAIEKAWKFIENSKAYKAVPGTDKAKVNKDFEEYSNDIFDLGDFAPTVEDGKLVIPYEIIKVKVAGGIKNIDDMVNSMKSQFSKELEGHSDREIRDAISGYGKEVGKNKDELKSDINKLKRIGVLKSMLDDLKSDP